ncbi:MAG: hypothetical protein HUK18_04060 [Bacteroidales bacterium]|nr:hypothetical protein [Bacteroidales bacterium]
MNSLREQILVKGLKKRKVHIALVGGQLAPVYNAIVADKADIVEVVYSEATVSQVDKLKDELNIPIIDSKPLAPTNPRKIQKRAKELADKYSNDDITVNISGGVKSWAYFFSIEFYNLENARVIYFDQNNVLWDYKEMKGIDDFEFDMYKNFRLYGNPLDTYKRFTDYTESDDKVAEKIENIRKQHPQQFNGLFIVQDHKEQSLLQQKIGRRCSNKDYSQVSWDKTAIREGGDTLLDISIFSKGEKFDYRLQSPHAFELAFDAGWFEYKIAKLFSGWDKAKEVLLDCRFQAANSADKNQIDVIVNAGTKIIFVECKTQIKAITDIDKFSSVVKTYGGSGSKGVFITYEKKNLQAKEKCKEKGLIDIDLSNNFSEEDFYKKMNDELRKLNA